MEMFARDFAESDQIRWEDWEKRPLLSRIREGFYHLFSLAIENQERGEGPCFACIYLSGYLLRRPNPANAAFDNARQFRPF
jgi:hypothetical protein